MGSQWGYTDKGNIPIFKSKVKNLDSQKSSLNPNPSLGFCLFLRRVLFGRSKERSDPINTKKKTANHCILQKQFFVVFCYFSPCARIMREKNAQTMKIWWLNYENLVAYYENLVALLCYL